MEARVERSSHMLTEMTRSIGITAAIPTSSQTLDQIELIALADQRVLMIVVTRDRWCAIAWCRGRARLAGRARLHPQLHQPQLRRLDAFGNPRRSERRLEQQSAAYDAMLKRLNVLYSKGLLDIEVAPEIHLEGASNLVGLDLHLTREKLRDLFHTLEEKKRILQLLDRFLEQPDGELAVQVVWPMRIPACASCR